MILIIKIIESILKIGSFLYDEILKLVVWQAFYMFYIGLAREKIFVKGGEKIMFNPRKCTLDKKISTTGN